MQSPMSTEAAMVERNSRCGAKTRMGTRCESPAMPNGRCRMHGGSSPGAPKGNKNALKHGRYTAEASTPSRQALPASAEWVLNLIRESNVGTFWPAST